MSTNSDMQKSVTNWPEILFVDGTYKLFNLRYTLYLLLVQNGNGRGEIGGVAITASETAHVLEWIAKTFRENNSKACQNTKCIMTDKDLTERKAFEAVFPGIKFLLCLLHTLKSFDKQLKVLKLDHEERCRCFKLLRELAYAKWESRYNSVYDRFISSAPSSVIEYFNINWHNNRDEWTLFGIAEVNYGSVTNNLVESTNKQIKTLCNRFSTLCEFAINFFELVRSSKQETSLLCAVDGLRKLNINHHLDESFNDYAAILTKIAVKQLTEEVKKLKNIKVIESCDNQKTCKILVNDHPHTSSATDCICYFRRSWKLPCAHILTVRKYFNLCLFCPELCDRKWLKCENTKH